MNRRKAADIQPDQGAYIGLESSINEQPKLKQRILSVY